jgi:hypothetical protein
LPGNFIGGPSPVRPMLLKPFVLPGNFIGGLSPVRPMLLRPFVLPGNFIGGLSPVRPMLLSASGAARQENWPAQRNVMAKPIRRR